MSKWISALVQYPENSALIFDTREDAENDMFKLYNSICEEYADEIAESNCNGWIGQGYIIFKNGDGVDLYIAELRERG